MPGVAFAPFGAPDGTPWAILCLPSGDELVTLRHGDGSEVLSPAFPLAAYRAALAGSTGAR